MRNIFICQESSQKKAPSTRPNLSTTRNCEQVETNDGEKSIYQLANACVETAQDLDQFVSVKDKYSQQLQGTHEILQSWQQYFNKISTASSQIGLTTSITMPIFQNKLNRWNAPSTIPSFIDTPRWIAQFSLWNPYRQWCELGTPGIYSTMSYGKAKDQKTSIKINSKIFRESTYDHHTFCVVL